MLYQCNNKESKISFKVNEKEQFTKLNVKHIVCYKLLTKRKYVTNNLGFWFGLTMMISLIIVITIANIKERESFYVKLSNIIIISKNNPSLKEDSYDYFEPRKTTSKTMTNTQIPSTKDMTNINDTYYDDILEFSCSYDYFLNLIVLCCKIIHL